MLRRRNVPLLLLALLVALISVPTGQASPGPSTLFHTYVPIVRKAGERRATGPGKSLTFKAGEPVIGSIIDVTDGNHYEGCYLASPGADGTVTDGVIWPSQAEINAATACQT